MFVVGLVILTEIFDMRWRRQAKFARTLSKNSQNDLEDQGQRPPFSVQAESIWGCMFGADLVILVRICDKLSRGLWVKMANMTFTIKGNYLHFQYQPTVSQDAYLVKIR